MPGSVDVAAILHELVQQQTAFGEQQMAFLQLQSETVRLQRLLLERALGLVGEEPAQATPHSDTLFPPAPAHRDEEVHTVATATATSPGDTAPTTQLPRFDSLHLENRGDGGANVRGGGYGRQFDQPNSVGVLVEHRPSDLERQNVIHFRPRDRR
jgi:hypothetical protein